LTRIEGRHPGIHLLQTVHHRGYSDGFSEVYTIEDAVYGVSVSHGPPGARQHVWTFVAAAPTQM